MITLTGDFKVIRKDKTSQNGNSYIQYSLMVSSKDKDENWHNGFLDANFPKDTDIANKSKIKVTNAFPIVDEYNGKNYIKWYVKEYELIEGGKVEEPNPDWMNVGTNEDLPFGAITR